MEIYEIGNLYQKFSHFKKNEKKRECRLAENGFFYTEIKKKKRHENCMNLKRKQVECNKFSTAGRNGYFYDIKQK